MNNTLSITRIDHEDPVSIAALAAEKRYFDYYGIDYRSHIVEMEEPTLRLRVIEAGEGPPLLMVPGGAGDAFVFAPIMAELTGWRIIAINRPGAGLSDGVDLRRVDLRRLAVDTIRTVADAFDLERAPIVCNSMGGLWSSWYALACPERVSAMVQIGCPALILDTSAPFFMRLIGVPGINRVITPQLQPKSVDSALDGLRFQGSSEEDIAGMPRAAADAAYHMYRLPTYLETWKTLIAAVATIRGANPRYRLRAEELEAIEQPVQFIWGDNDVFGDLGVAREATRLIPDARLHEMQAGHVPMLDKPQATAAVIREFLGSPPLQIAGNRAALQKTAH